jgi:hypothetical protein
MEVKITAAVSDAAPQMVGLRAKVLKTYKSKGRPRVKIEITEDNPCYRIGDEICLEANPPARLNQIVHASFRANKVSIC